MTDVEWMAQNKSFLLAELRRIKLTVELRAQEREGTAEARAQELARSLSETHSNQRALAGAMAVPPALLQLVDIFGLSSFERAVLGMCVGMELDGALVRSMAALQEKRGERGITWSLALGFLPDADWCATVSDGPLLKYNLLHVVEASEGLVRQQLRVDERILHYVLGVESGEPRLKSIASPCPAGAALSPVQLGTARKMLAAFTSAESERPPIINVTGRHLATLYTLSALVIERAGGIPWLLHPELLNGQAQSSENLLRILSREWLLNSTSFVVHAEALEGTAGSPGKWLIERFPGMVIVVGQASLARGVRPQLDFELPAPRRDEQTAMWLAALAASPLVRELVADPKEAVAQCAGHFVLEGSQVHQAVQRGLVELEPTASSPPSNESLSAAFWNGALSACRQSFDGLAQRVERLSDWKDMTFEPHVEEALRSIVSQSRHAAQVLGEWGFEERYGRGLGISALFSGPSGTGKTSAAEVIARELKLDLYRIDLANMVSKWIGETEKNLAKVFDAAESGGAILLFDEADALFAKRTAINDSHDRHANTGVSYLLQRLEAFSGITLLTTNLADNIDPAFMRRLRFSVQFGFPDREMRKVIWTSSFPSHTPKCNIEFDKLAQLSVTGAVIRNIALSASYLAAERQLPVTMDALRAATVIEYRKIDQPITTNELHGWGTRECEHGERTSA